MSAYSDQPKKCMITRELGEVSICICLLVKAIMLMILSNRQPVHQFDWVTKTGSSIKGAIFVVYPSLFTLELRGPDGKLIQGGLITVFDITARGRWIRIWPCGGQLCQQQNYYIRIEGTYQVYDNAEKGRAHHLVSPLEPLRCYSLEFVIIVPALSAILVFRACRVSPPCSASTPLTSPLRTPL